MHTHRKYHVRPSWTVDFYNQEENSHQKLTILAAWSWTSSLQKLTKQIAIISSYPVCDILLWQTDLFVVPSLNRVWLFVTPRTATCQASLYFTVSWSLLRFTSTESAALFSFCPQSFPASGSFPMTQLFSSGGQSIGVSASASVLPMDSQCWFPLGWTDLFSLRSKGFSRLFSHTLSMGFYRWESWSGLPFSSPGDLPKPGIELMSLSWNGRWILYH